MGVTLRDIRESDLENIMAWRMAPEITRYMNTNPSLTMKKRRVRLRSLRQSMELQLGLICAHA